MNRPSDQILKTEQKALEINLDESIYGTFAEIGAGQEVARNFFKVGAAAGTIAKTMSAYDKTYSDAIYGAEKSGRYVCESRLYNMLNHEWQLLEERLRGEKTETNFFVFADTITTINYTKTVKGQGWLGVRFQKGADSPVSEMVIHAKMKDGDTSLQQDAVGILGVNMLYACFYYSDVKSLVASLMDGLNERISIDLIRLKGPQFDHIDSVLMSLYMVRFGLTDVTIFDENGQSIHASEFLYKQSLMIVRGSFNPPTLVTLDVIEKGFAQFIREPEVEKDAAHMITELTLDYLKDENGQIDEADFLTRANLLKSLGQKVLISNQNNHQMLINYMSDYKIRKLGLVIGVRELREIIWEKFDQNRDGRLLVSMGELFNRNIKIYVYPEFDKDSQSIWNARNLIVPEGMYHLYVHLFENQQIEDIHSYNPEILNIYPSDVLNGIRSGNNSWKEKVPEPVRELIESRKYYQ